MKRSDWAESGGGRVRERFIEEGRKRFFFEKKKQKTSAMLGRGL
jgi:hypothetical protein